MCYNIFENFLLKEGINLNNIELLSPVGDFECLKAAVQNGADAVYLGLSSFSARASAKNFNLEELKKQLVMLN